MAQEITGYSDHKFIKIRRLAFSKHALKKKPKIYLHKPLLIPQKDQKFNVFGHTKGTLKRLSM